MINPFQPVLVSRGTRAFRYLAIAVILMAGCSQQSDRTPTAQVTGTVTLDGRLLKVGVIMLQSETARLATGKIADGAIVEVTTYEPNDGAPLGDHKVAIQTAPAEGAGMSPPSASPKTPGPGYMGVGAAKDGVVVPRTYANPNSSGLTATIEEGTNELTFALESGNIK